MFDTTERQEREKRWAQALRQGDQNIMALLYDAYAPVLLGLISRIVRDKEKAETVLLQTFLAIWQQKASCDPEKAGLLTWMILLAKETALESIRSGALPSFQDDHKNITFDRPEPGKNFCNLKPEEKAALDLIYLKGYTCAEAAAALRISEEALKNSLKLAVKQLGTETAS